MLIRNQSIFGVLKMIENNVNVIDMEKEQLKQVLKNIAKQNNMTASDLATQAGVAPSTITGFLNDVPGRGHYGLSARTQGKISEAFPEFKEQIDAPTVISGEYDLPIIGMWDSDYRVNGLELGMPSSFRTNLSANIQSYSSIIRSPQFFTFIEKDNEKCSGLDFIKETRYYIFKNTYAENMMPLLGKQVYARTNTGNFIGYLSIHKNIYHLHNFFGKRIENAEQVLKATKIEWTRQV